MQNINIVLTSVASAQRRNLTIFLQKKEKKNLHEINFGGFRASKTDMFEKVLKDGQK